MELHCHAYDVMDQVHVAISIRETPDSSEETPEWTALVRTTFQGTGETDRRTWVQDALVAALERL